MAQQLEVGATRCGLLGPGEPRARSCRTRHSPRCCCCSSARVLDCSGHGLTHLKPVACQRFRDLEFIGLLCTSVASCEPLTIKRPLRERLGATVAGGRRPPCRWRLATRRCTAPHLARWEGGGLGLRAWGFLCPSHVRSSPVPRQRLPRPLRRCPQPPPRAAGLPPCPRRWVHPWRPPPARAAAAVTDWPLQRRPCRAPPGRPVPKDGVRTTLSRTLERSAGGPLGRQTVNPAPFRTCYSSGRRMLTGQVSGAW
jgi:hypothetical protein